MKIRFFPSALAFACLLSLAASQCDISMMETDQKPFPDILKKVGDSYMMTVEYTLPVSKQTDYYTEYYDVIEKDGRLDSHIGGNTQKYIYFADTMESWTIDDKNCKFAYTNDTADFFKDDMTEWRHFPKGSFFPTTVGPSAMFKNALDVWNNQLTDDRRVMAYMGKSKDLIRGESAVYWRRCTEDRKDFVDYYFAASFEETPFQSEDDEPVPLRVAFYGVSEVEQEEFSYQFYDVITFQDYIQMEIDAFGLPKGMGCGRIYSDSDPTPPDFTKNNIYFSAEALYERFSTKDNDKSLMAGYYSTLTLTVDRQLNHLAYYTSQWNTTKPSKGESDTPKGKPLEYIIFDSTNEYLYNISVETGECKTDRAESYIPQYNLPENRGTIAITDSSVLLPDKERVLKFLTEGKVRGLEVNIFEMVDTDLKLGDEKTIDKVIVTHSYLKPNVKSENTVAIKEAPVQMEIRVYRTDDTLELLTFNVFSFTTKPHRENEFDLSSCFPNDNNYSYLTIGFEIDLKLLSEVKQKRLQFEQSVIDSLTERSQLNAVRVSSPMTDIKDNYAFVTLLIFNRPSFTYDFPSNQSGRSIANALPDDIQGMGSFASCAQSCLEEKAECWGFAVCGATCYYGSAGSKEVETKNGCNLYTRYSNKTSILSNDKLLNNIVRNVEAGEFKIDLPLSSGMEVLTATIAEVTNPAEDDTLFDKMGNQLNDRMRVVKAGTKLKTGTSIKNLGKLRYDQCQTECLDFKDCETVSYCMDNSECLISKTYAAELKLDDQVDNQLCNLLARKYTDHFDRTPGITVGVEGDDTLDLPNLQDCARACLKQDKFECLSFDHCSGGSKGGCRLFKAHFHDPNDRKTVAQDGVQCGHYRKKFSYEFKREENTQIIGNHVQTITNLTVEECAKTCMEYGKGTCYGYDFCQDKGIYASSCTLFDTDPSRLDSKYSPICTHFSRTSSEFAPRPFSNAYAGGIGFLCFLIGGILGAGVVFIIAYVRVNRG